MTSDNRSNSMYYSDRSTDRDRDRDYDRRSRDHYRYDDRKLSSNRAREPSPPNYRRRDANDRYYRDRYNDYGHHDSYRSRDSHYRSDRDRDYYSDYRDRDRYEMDRYRSPPPYRDGPSNYNSRRDNYYRSDRDYYPDYRDRDRDRDYYSDYRERDRDMDRHDDYQGDRNPRRNRRYNYEYSPSYQSGDRPPNDNYYRSNPVFHTPVHPPSDHHVRELSEPREIASEAQRHDSKTKDDQSTRSYQNYTSALLAGTSIKTSMNMPAGNKMLLRKPTNEALKAVSSNSSEHKPSGVKDNMPLVDPRAKNASIGKGTVVLFDCIELSNSHRVATTLESPIVDFCTEGSDVFNSIHADKIVVSPLERLNHVLYQKIQPLSSEKWIPGCKTLMFVGLPRNLTSIEALQLLCEIYQKSRVQSDYDTIYDDDWVTDDEDVYSGSKTFVRKKFNEKLARLFGIVEFHLLFGEASKASNALDLHYPQSTWKRATSSISEANPIKIPESPYAMAASVFTDELKAKQFWIALNSITVQVYSSIVQSVPDPLGLRVYAEALSAFLDPELLKQNKPTLKAELFNNLQKPKKAKKSDITLDLTIDLAPPKINASSIYLTENGFTHSQTVKNNVTAKKDVKDNLFVIPIIIEPAAKNGFMSTLGRMGFQVKWIGNYCCLEATDDKLLESNCVDTRTFNTPTGDQILCIFIKYNELLIPLVQKLST